MINIKENQAEVVLGNKDVQIRISKEKEQTVLYFTSLDEEQVIRVCMPEVSLKNVLDTLNGFYYTNYFSKSVQEETRKTLRTIEEHKRMNTGGN